MRQPSTGEGHASNTVPTLYVRFWVTLKTVFVERFLTLNRASRIAGHSPLEALEVAHAQGIVVCVVE